MMNKKIGYKARQRQYKEKYNRKFPTRWFKYCREPLENIEGWDKMLNDTSNTRWHLHHLDEIQGEVVISMKELINRGEYYGVTADKLIFLTKSEHHSLHNIDGRSPMYERTGDLHPMFGKHHTEESKKKMSDAAKGRTPSEETRKKLSDAGKGKRHSEETRKKMSDAQKGELNHMYGKTGDLHPNYGTNKYGITEEDLYELYVVQCLSQKEIGNIIGCSQPLIRWYLRKYNIKR